MVRPATWEADLARALDVARDRPFGWWTHDCVTAACRLAGAAMGRDLLAWVEAPWRTALAARRVLAANAGLLGLLATIAHVNGLRREIAPRMAGRGALVAVRDARDTVCAGCLVGDRVAVVQQAGMALLPPARIVSAWAD